VLWQSGLALRSDCSIQKLKQQYHLWSDSKIDLKAGEVQF
jgi:hypothetical protein